MTYLELNLELGAVLVKILREFATQVAVFFKEELAVAFKETDLDPDLIPVWKEDLRAHSQSDVNILMELLHDERFGKDKIALSLSNAEAVLRGCSAIRLKTKERYLKEIPDSDLENGTVNLGVLSSQTQRAYACYVFFANLQSIVLGALGPQTNPE